LQEIIEKTFVIPRYGSTELVPFLLNKPQVDFLYNLVDKNIILKARKEGFTTLIAAVCIIFCDVLPNTRVQFLADNDANALAISNKTKNLITRAKYKYSADIQKRDILFSNGSEILIAMAGRKSAGRGDDFHIVHFSELATFEYPDVYDAVVEACGKGALIIMESTANGRNLYYSIWSKAVKGFPKESAYKPFFYGWNEHPDNTMPIPEGFKKTKEETDLQVEFNLSDEQICWRREKINSMPNPEKFPQEHPISPSEAFLSSGTPIFSPKSLESMRQSLPDSYRLCDLELSIKGEIYAVDRKAGYWSIFKMPLPGHVYVAGGDCAEGVEGGDFNTLCIIDTFTGQQVAEFCARCDPDQCAYEFNKGGIFYNYALMAPERNGYGFTVISHLVNDHHYPNMYQEIDEKAEMYSDATEKYGFRTNSATRPILIDITKRIIRKGLIKINSNELIEECLSFINTKTGKAQHDAGKHDDRVFAFMISCYILEKFPELAEQKNKQGNSLYSQFKKKPVEVRSNVGRGGY